MSREPRLVAPASVSGLTRRHFVAAGLGGFAAATLGSVLAHASAPSLAVFVHVDAKLRYFQGLLRDALPSVDVTVYSRFGDAIQAIDGGANALLALRSVLEYQGLKLALSGHVSGQTTEPYVLIANGRQVEPKSVRRVGTVDLLGRRGTQQWVERLLGANPEVNRVTKFEDLLPMLQLEMVDAVLIPEAVASLFREKSRLPLQTTHLGAQVGLPALSVLKPGGERIVPALSHVGGHLNHILRIGGWQ